MDFYTLQEKTDYPFRFSWIALDPEEDNAKVLLDCHNPKGPHYHADGDKDGVPFVWGDVDAAYEFFLKKIEERFGPLEAEEL